MFPNHECNQNCTDATTMRLKWLGALYNAPRTVVISYPQPQPLM